MHVASWVAERLKTSPTEQIITDPAGRYASPKIKNTTDAARAPHSPPATMKKRRTDRQMPIRKIKKSLYKKINRKNNLISLGHLNMTLDSNDRSTGSKGFCESQEQLMSLITESDLEDPWRPQHPNGTSMAGVILTPVLTGLTQLLT